jgi:hypothetical protein
MILCYLADMLYWLLTGFVGDIDVVLKDIMLSLHALFGYVALCRIHTMQCNKIIINSKVACCVHYALWTGE